MGRTERAVEAQQPRTSARAPRLPALWPECHARYRVTVDPVAFADHDAATVGEEARGLRHTHPIGVAMDRALSPDAPGAAGGERRVAFDRDAQREDAGEQDERSARDRRGIGIGENRFSRRHAIGEA